MKRSLFALALALGAAAGAASAQSTVSLFGVIDLALTRVDNGAASTVNSLSQDGQSSSRFGVRAVEDLGGGLRAIAWIEGSVGADTGCGGPTIGATPSCPGHTWQRRSTVSVAGPFGELRLGRDYVPTFWNLVDFSPFGYNGIGSPAGTASTLGSGATTFVRANNTVGYFLPPLGGLYGQAMVAAGEGTTGNKYAGGRLGYAGGPVNVAVSYGRTSRTGTMADAYTVFDVGAAYTVGVLTLQGYFGRYEYLDRKQDQALLGVLVRLGSGTLKGSYIRARGELGPSGRSQGADQIAVGYVHDLSKRTALYGTYATIDNKDKNGGASGASGALFTVGNGSLDGFQGGQRSRGLQLGIRHNF